MALTAAQRERRKLALGSSDMSAILGINPYKSAYDVWLEKTGKLEETSDTGTPLAADAGNRFEPAVLEWAEEQLGKLTTHPDALEVRHPTLPIVSHPDAIVKESGEPVEAKTAGLFSPLSKDWGEPGSDEIPVPYVVQAHVHIIVTKASQCHLPAFLGGRGFEMFHVESNPDLLEIIAVKAGQFWTNHVQADIPPENVLPSLNFAKLTKRIAGKTSPVDERLISEFIQAKSRAKEATEEMETVQQMIFAALGDAEASDPTAAGQLTYFMQGRTDIDRERLKEEMPQIWDKYLKQTKFRVLRIKKAK